MADVGPPPGLGPRPGPDPDAPPGLARASDGAHPGPSKPPGIAAADSVDAVAESLGQVQVKEDVDEPEPALKGHVALTEVQSAIQAQAFGDTIYRSAATFEELGLRKELLQGVYTEMGFEKPSSIQATTLPMILTPPYRDLIAQAHNGSGKTTCFVLAMLSRVDVNKQVPQALCVCPTRELVTQNLAVLMKMGRHTGVSATSTADEQAVRRRDKINDQVVIGTHGRLKNWVSKRVLDLDCISLLVFDEADEMLKGDAFGDDSVRMIKTIRKKNSGAQILLFSATFNEVVKGFALRICPEANQVFVAKEELSLDVIAQVNVICHQREDKQVCLKNMIFPNCDKLGQTIIFVRSREMARKLHSLMEKEGYKCTSIQGDMDFDVRDRVVREFRDGITKILISTDVLSRGFDVSQVTLVVNYDIPVERDGRTAAFETYLHRIGRSGRFGRKGAAFNLMSGHQDVHLMRDIGQYFNKYIPEIQHDDEDGFLAVLQQAGLMEAPGS